MTSKKTLELKPSSKGRKTPGEFARRAREIQDRFVAEGRVFSDSAKTIRADRDSR
ncbi:MAG: hypothetical protein H0V75_13005 [Rubrobacter sp.]|jgi:hypothetical protein|nr:hypothetical protein [Rubrobacter sp.]